MKGPLLKIAFAILFLSLLGLRFLIVEDPRGAQKIQEIVRDRESRAFRDRLSRGLREDIMWPGLRAAQVSWTWLELLQGAHIPESYEGDFSWMFSKLYTVAQYADHREIAYLGSLAPFYYVIGKDHAGATILFEELIQRAPESYNIWFWGAFHALDNLYHKRMAAHAYGEAALKPQAPDYLTALSLRLRYGDEAFENPHERARILGQNLSPEMRERLQRARPDWLD
jgi:hypothetical protein